MFTTPRASEAPSHPLPLGSEQHRALIAEGFAFLETGLAGEPLKQRMLAIGNALGCVVPSRREHPLVDELRPKTQEQSHAKSLSAMTGLGAQPWHMDGAHLRQPYRYILLASPKDDEERTQTLICRQSEWGRGHGLDLRALVFGFGAGSGDFLDTIQNHPNYFRFDPGCMQAQSAQANALLQKLAHKKVKGEKAMTWSTGSLLILDNWKMLHRRLDASENQKRLLYRVSVM